MIYIYSIRLGRNIVKKITMFLLFYVMSMYETENIVLL